MKILVTGGAGFIGYNLCKKLKTDGHDVISIDNYSTGKKENEVDGVTYYHSDIAYGINKTIVEDIEVVIHLAAYARIQPSFSNPVSYARNNVISTFYVCELCRELGIPLVFAGSSSHHSGKYKNPYTFTKDISEETVQLYQNLFNLKGSIARFYNVYGPHQLEGGEYATVIGKWDKAHREKKPLTIYGDGSKERDFTHVDDIVDGLIKIWQKEAYGNIFELGRGIKFSLKEVAELYNPSFGINYEKDKKGEAQSTLCNSKLAREILEWKPKLNLEDWIKRKDK